MLNKAEYIASQRQREQEARDNGYSEAEIRKAYEIAREMGVGYLSDFTLEEARERLKIKI